MLILDFYVDEPACFGVPPYLSPYCRYTAGALVSSGVPQEKVDYLTVDKWREQGKELTSDPEIVFLVAGSTVPGKYLGGKIGTVKEVLEFLEFRKKRQKGGATLIGGPIRYAPPEIRKQIEDLGGILIRGDMELYAERLAAHPAGFRAALDELEQNRSKGERRNYEQVDRWATAGAFLTNLHPNFPYLILELETYRGCTRDIFCAFCTEAFYGKPDFRKLEGILSEVRELDGMGNRYYRLGRQADLMTYLPDMNDFQNSFPRPVPDSLERLYAGVREASPDLKLLHLDNINPGLIATFPEESREITRIICEYNTAGDTAAMGLETADPLVVKLNDLKCSEDEAMRAIEIINEFGARRENGIPKLLPGINFLHGLPGETDRTFQMNYDFLKKVQERGLLLRRINIRQTVTYKNTKMERIEKDEELMKDIPRKRRKPGTIEQKFLYYRDKIRDEIDKPMLQASFPAGSLVREVILEDTNQGFYLGRPLGSYPITLKIPLSDKKAQEFYEAGKPLTVIVTGYNERSITGLTYPIHINQLGTLALQTMPGIGKKTAANISLKQPLGSFEDLKTLTEGNVFAAERDYVF